MEIDDALKLADRLKEVVTPMSPEYVKGCVVLASELLSTRRELAELREQVRWIPVGEKLPEMYSELASEYVDVLYRYVDDDGRAYGKCYYLKSVQYWKEYGWVFDWKTKPRTFEEVGYIVELWQHHLPLPLPAAEGEK